ncbi:MAG: aspartate-semialdehyde dehydrogenase [Flavobacteriales bacterium]|jgi:aspartate-semialdehyde dehydrogenase
MKIAVIGSTGLVGTKMLQILEERGFHVDHLIPVASEKSIGKKLNFGSQEWEIVGLETAVQSKPDIALFSAGGAVSIKWAPRFAEAGAYVIDNSSAWRMNEDVPLVVPEINADCMLEHQKIIANPNCSTIQLALVLSPIHKAYGIKRVIVSTYQSITGTGVKAVDQMQAERNGVRTAMAYPYPIDKNCLPHCDVFLDNGYTKEEMKIVEESRKILKEPALRISATAVRVPVVGGHSESVNLELNSNFEIADVRKLLNQTDGITVQDNPDTNVYPMPLIAHDKDDVFVGRIRCDESNANTLNMWIVSDNLRKGAATNAVQIAEMLVKMPWFGKKPIEK